MGNAVSHREPNLGCRGADRPGWCDVYRKKGSTRAVEWARAISPDELICSLGHCECDGHTVHKLSQQDLTANWLPHGRETVHRCAVRSPLTCCQLTSRPSEFLRYSTQTDTCQTALVIVCNLRALYTFSFRPWSWRQKFPFETPATVHCHTAQTPDRATVL